MPETQASHDEPRFHQLDQLRAQPLLVAATSTIPTISSLFMAYLSFCDDDSTPEPRVPGRSELRTLQLYIMVDQVQLAASTKIARRVAFGQHGWNLVVNLACGAASICAAALPFPPIVRVEAI
jgi:hypothetical protein